MVGDRASTDGLFARQVGCKFAQVLTGVASSASSSDVDHLVVPDLASFARMLIDAQI
jgi:ribonucleotide monophosphatase NagD (HAD superfamily)